MDKKEVFKSYIEENDILVVDKNTSSRNRLLKIMVDLGAKRHMIHTAGHLEEATQIIETKKIGIVLSDYFIGGGSGFDLFKVVREKFPNNKKLSLILVTSNISQSAVAKAAEEDVDSFVIKPYTLQSIQENLVSTIAAKVQPSEYVLKIEEGKARINTGKYADAMTILKEAIPLHPRPALALFYLGQAEYLQEQSSQAQGSYNKGLAFNNIHFKCLLGLYEIFMRQEKFHEAYQVVKKIAQYFPANPDRLTQIVRLSVRTENYDDMQFYYEVFTTLEERTSAMVNYIGSGMYIAGKYNMLNNKFDEASRYFDNIAVSCSEFTKFIRAIISLLVEYDKTEEAEKFMKRFPAGGDISEDFMVSEFLILSKKLKNPSSLVKRGLDIYNKNVRDPFFLKVMIEAMEKSGYNDEKLAPFRKSLQDIAS